MVNFNQMQVQAERELHQANVAAAQADATREEKYTGPANARAKLSAIKSAKSLADQNPPEEQ
jgi:hypothetical protein